MIERARIPEIPIPARALRLATRGEVLAVRVIIVQAAISGLLLAACMLGTFPGMAWIMAGFPKLPGEFYILGGALQFLPTFVAWFVVSLGSKRFLERQAFKVCWCCRYSLLQLADEGVCPECGTPYTQPRLAAYWRSRYLVFQVPRRKRGSLDPWDSPAEPGSSRV